jgi:alpha-D-glucose phosphate-specific phosphoglucomutase
VAIHFGTDGWRAVISDEFTFENVRKVTQAIADELLTKSPSASPTYVVGFDTRFLSDRYAIEVARVLAGNGVRVLLCKADAPTPVVSYAIVAHHADGGVMITASHNPPRYNGLKLKAAYGGSAPPQVCRQVEARLIENEATGRAPHLADLNTAQAEGWIERFDPFPVYRQHLATLVDLDAIRGFSLRVMVDPMYGAGRVFLAELLREAGVEVTEIHGELNPGFGGLHPEPIARYLSQLMREVPAGRFDLGLATDGDADRIGAVTSDGRFVDPHAILALLLRYLVERRGLRGAVVKTVSTTQMLNRLAEKYSLPLLETPVGFNYIADLMIHRDVLIGGEESGGISIKGHIPEGDGLLIGMLLVEMVAREGKPLHRLLAELQDEIGPFYYARHDVRLDEGPTAAPLDKKNLVSLLSQNSPTQLAGIPVSGIDCQDGIKYILQDGSWLLIRPSGTEPILRIYAEASSPEIVHRLLGEGQRLGTQIEAIHQV